MSATKTKYDNPIEAARWFRDRLAAKERELAQAEAAELAEDDRDGPSRAELEKVVKDLRARAEELESEGR